MSQPKPISNRVAVVFLVTPDGRILLQLRDDRAPVSPNQWTAPGGHIEPGEEPEAAARRELLEETGLRVEGPLRLFWQGTYDAASQPSALTEVWIYCARTSARQEDVVVGEGAAMEFVTPERALTLDLGISAAHYVPLFLASEEYRWLAGDDPAGC